MEFPHKSDIWGPGMWYNIHIKGKYAIDEKSINEYIDYLYFILPKLPCDICKDHATDYIKNNPPEKYKNMKNKDGVNIGMFKWSWTFHNAVNSRLKNPIIDYYTAMNMYEDLGICTGSCGN